MSLSRINGLAIVVVEDHDDARRYLELFLRQLGAKVMVAGNAFEGLELIKHSPPVLVLSDIKMPGMDGFELLDEIRALGPEAGGSVPVIAMSASFSQTERARTHYADFRACLPNPFTPEELMNTILGVLLAASHLEFRSPFGDKPRSAPLGGCSIVLQVHLAGIKAPWLERLRSRNLNLVFLSPSF